MATLVANPLTNGQKVEYTSVAAGDTIETANDFAGKAWSVENLSSGKVSDTGTFSATTTINAQFATKPATGNLMVVVVVLQSNVRLTEPSGWTQVADAGSTSRAIGVFAKVQDGTVNAATNIAATTGSNVTGTWTAINFAGPVDSDTVASAAGTVEHFTSTSATSDSQTPSARTSGSWPMLRLSVVAFSSDRSSVSVSGGDSIALIGYTGNNTATRYGIAWDKESETATTYATTQTPTDTTWSWSTGGTGSDVICEFLGSGVYTPGLDQSTIAVGATAIPFGQNQAGLLFDTSAIGTDTISSAKFEIKASSNQLSSTKKIELIGTRASTPATYSTNWAEVFDSQSTLTSSFTTIYGSMTGANITSNVTASSASFNNFNGSSGLNDDTQLKLAINKTGTTKLRLIAEENRTTFTDSTENIVFHGNGVAGTDHDPKLTVVYAPPATTANATVATATGAANSGSGQISPPSTVATATGAAYTASAKGQPTATVAAGTGTATTSSTQIVATSEAATITGASYDGTVSTSGSGTTATADVSTGTGAGYDSTGQISLTGTVSAGTGTGYDPAANITLVAGFGTGTGSSYDGTVSTSGTGTTATADVGIVTGAGYDSAGKITTSATSSSATVTGLTITGTLEAGPATAAGTVALYDSARLLSGSAAVATVTGEASVGNQTVGALASAAAGVTAGYTTSQQIGVQPTVAVGTVAAFDGALFVGQPDLHPYLLVLDYTTGALSDHDLTATVDQWTGVRLDYQTVAVADGNDRNILG